MAIDDQETQVSLVVRVKDFATQAINKLTTGFRRLQEISSGRSNGSAAERLAQDLQRAGTAAEKATQKVERLNAAEQKLNATVNVRFDAQGRGRDERGRFIPGLSRGVAGTVSQAAAPLPRFEPRVGGRDRAELENRIALLARMTQFESTRGSALQRLHTIEQALTNALARGNLTKARTLQLEQALASTRHALAASTDNATASVNRHQTGVQRLTAWFDVLRIRGVAAWAAIGTAAASFGVALAAGPILMFLGRTNIQFQKLLTQLRTFSGSEEAARGIFGEIESFARTTPFELQEVVQSFITLRTAGIKPTEEMMLAFGDQASSFGARINDLAEAVRAATTGEMERLKQFGIVARLEGDKIHASFNGAVTTIGRDARSIVNYLIDISQANFSGAMEREMKTLGGTISTLQDNIFKMSTAIGEGGLTPALINVTNDLIEFTDAVIDNREEIAKWTQVILGIFGVTVNLGLLVPRVVLNAVQSVFRMFNLLFNGFKSLTASSAQAVVEVMRRVSEAVTGTQNETLRSLEQRLQEFRSTTNAAIAESFTNIAQDGRESFSAFSSIANSAMGLWKASTSAIDESSVAARRHAERLTTIDAAYKRRMDSINRIMSNERSSDEQKKKATTELIKLQQELGQEIIKAHAAGDAARVGQLNVLQTRTIAAGKGQLEFAPSTTTAPGGKKKDVIEEEIKRFSSALRIDDVNARSTAIEGLRRRETQLREELQKGTLTLEKRIDIHEKLALITDARDDAFKSRLDFLEEALEHEETRSTALLELQFTERGLTNILRTGNLTYEERIKKLRELAEVQAKVKEARGVATTGPLEAAADRAINEARAKAGIKPQSQRDELGLPGGEQKAGESQEQFNRRIDTALNESVAKSVQINLELTGDDKVFLGLSRVVDAMRGGLTEAQALDQVLLDMGTDTMRMFGDAVTSAFAAMVTGSQSAGAAFAGAMLGAISAIAKRFGDLFLANAVASVASIFGPIPNPGGAAAAAKWTAAAVAMYALAGAAGGAAQSVGGGGGGGGSSSVFRDTEKLNDELAVNEKEAVLVLEGDGIDFRDDQQVQRMARIMQEVDGRKLVIRRRRGRSKGV